MPLAIPILDKVLLDFVNASLLDNLCDRAHYVFTTVLLFYFSILIAGKQMFGEPIRCMTPAEYSGDWAKYVNEFCFSTSTFVNSIGGYDKSVPGGVININYYQWVPYFFLVQAMLFYLPHSIWTHFQQSADLDFDSAVRHAVKIRHMTDVKKREVAMKKLAAYLCKVNRMRNKTGTAGGLGSFGSYVYVASKIVNLINVAVQFVIIALFAGQGSLGWGFKHVLNALNGIYWEKGGFFPRVAYCNFTQLSDPNLPKDRTVQCALMINMLNEKLFLIVYFWFLILFGVTLVDTVWALAHHILGYGRVWFGKHYLKLMDGYDSQELKTELEIRQFISHTLGNDGLLLFHFIDNQVGNMVAGEIACCFYTKSITDPEGLRDEEELADDKDDEEKDDKGDKKKDD